VSVQPSIRKFLREHLQLRLLREGSDRELGTATAIEPIEDVSSEDGSETTATSLLGRRSSGSGEPYAFEAGVIRLNAKDLEAWRKDYPNLSLEAELRSLSEWAGRPENAKGWFYAVQGALAKRNRESALAVERQSRSHGAGPRSTGSAALGLCPVSPAMRTASDILTDLGVKLRSTQPGNQKALCPQCSHRRKKKREPCLSVSIDGKGVRFQCHNADCGWHGGRFYDDQSASGRVASDQGDRSRDRLTYGDLHRRARLGWRAPA
jgi:hypothetical protein